MSVILAYISVITIWSTTPLSIYWSNEGWGYLFAVTARMLIGAVFCLLVMRVMNIKLAWHRQALFTYFAATIGIFGSMLCVYWGAQFIPSGLVAVLFGLNPIFTSILSSWWLNESNFTIGRISGTLLGFTGILIIFRSDIGFDGAETKGIVAVLLSVLLHASSAIWIKKSNAELPAISVTAGSLLVSVPLFLIVWLLFGQSQEFSASTFNYRAAMAIGYLGIFGSVFGFSLYFYILKKLDASKVALITLVTPVLALLLGNVLNNEVIPFNVLIGAMCIVFGLFLHQWADILIRRLRVH